MNISEIAKKYDLSADTIRYYERIGAIPRVRRTSTGIRNFSEEDESWIRHVCCLRAAGVPMVSIVRYAKLYAEGPETKEQRRAILMEARTSLLEAIEKATNELARLDEKLALYDQGKIQ